MIEVIEYTRDDIIWPFSSESPYMRVGRSKYGCKVDVDPTPAYGHQYALTCAIAEQVATSFPVEWPVSICLLPVEGMGRTNGTTSHEVACDYDAPRDENGNYPSAHKPTIYLAAKRIPIHPGMTRYVVAHEYGHVVEDWIKVRDRGTAGDSTLIKRYAELRGMESSPTAYGAGLWHATPGEVFANDFRILVCDIEPEFWPHPGIPRPEECSSIRQFWDEQLANCGLGSHAVAAGERR